MNLILLEMKIIHNIIFQILIIIFLKTIYCLLKFVKINSINE